MAEQTLAEVFHLIQMDILENELIYQDASKA